METHFAAPCTKYVVDSGTNFHMVKFKDHMSEYIPFHQAREVKLRGRTTLRAQVSGIFRVTFTCKGRPHTALFGDVLFVLKLCRNLISVSKLTDDDYTIRITRQAQILSKDESSVEAM